jgi:hypothetical protein
MMLRFNRESVDLFQKLFLTSIIAFIAPHTAVQVIIAALFAFMMVRLLRSSGCCVAAAAA